MEATHSFSPLIPVLSMYLFPSKPEHFLFVLHTYILTFPHRYVYFTPVSFGRVFYYHSRRNRWLMRHLLSDTSQEISWASILWVNNSRGRNYYSSSPCFSMALQLLPCTLVLLVQAQGIISSYVPSMLAA